MCSLTMQTEGTMNLIFGTSNPLMSAYKWEVCGSLRVAPPYTARSDLFLTLKYSPQFNSLALVVHSQLMVCLCWWRGGILFCFIVGFSQSHSV